MFIPIEYTGRLLLVLAKRFEVGEPTPGRCHVPAGSAYVEAFLAGGKEKTGKKSIKEPAQGKTDHLKRVLTFFT
jgi:hypothetical protein